MEWGAASSSACGFKLPPQGSDNHANNAQVAASIQSSCPSRKTLLLALRLETFITFGLKRRALAKKSHSLLARSQSATIDLRGVEGDVEGMKMRGGISRGSCGISGCPRWSCGQIPSTTISCPTPPKPLSKSWKVIEFCVGRRDRIRPELRYYSRRGGGIGRRAGLRIQCRKASGFDSRLSHLLGWR